MKYFAPFALALLTLVGCGSPSGQSDPDNPSWHPNNRPEEWSVVTTPSGLECEAWYAGEKNGLMGVCIDPTFND